MASTAKAPASRKPGRNASRQKGADWAAFLDAVCVIAKLPGLANGVLRVSYATLPGNPVPEIGLPGAGGLSPLPNLMAR